MTNYIYTSKKTGIAYELEGSHIFEGKVRFTLYSEAEQDRITVTESTLKRWYKKSVEVDFTAAEEKPENTEDQAQPKTKKAKKTEKRSFSKKPIGSKLVDGIPYGCIRNTIDHKLVPFKQAIKVFGEISVSKTHATIHSEGFGTRRAYLNKDSGNLFIRFNCQTVEFDGLTLAVI